MAGRSVSAGALAVACRKLVRGAVSSDRNHSPTGTIRSSRLLSLRTINFYDLLLASLLHTNHTKTATFPGCWLTFIFFLLFSSLPDFILERERRTTVIKLFQGYFFLFVRRCL